MTDTGTVTRWVTGGFGVVKSRVMVLLLLLNQEMMQQMDGMVDREHSRLGSWCGWFG
jgi:hypothetical protein